MPFMPHLSKQSAGSKKGNIHKHKHTNSVSSAEDCTNYLIASLAAGSAIITAGSAPTTESESAAESTAESIAESVAKSKSSPQPEPSEHTSPPPTDTTAAIRPAPDELPNRTPGAPPGV
ncbi:hypothetical protein CNMCM7691_009809 [Aspergillus felis]|uniref:Uncharacterized protein n=1 Tax=Aspergillus felis TaxID=1287682 RepID=A0A8H6QWV9_9EURO|nr:hypothetical protein CNMCM7691_009809 [Aspergillus felis]